MLKNKKLPNITDIYIKKCIENNLTKLKNIMAQNFEHISHIKNSDIQENINFYGLTPTDDNSDAVGSSPIKLNVAKRPTNEDIVDGEIAVNYKKGHETLTIKNTEEEIVGFINENDFNQAQEIIADAFSDIKVQINNVNGGINDLEERISTNENALNEVELVTASAFNDLNSRMEDSATKTEVNSLTTRVDTINNAVTEINDNIDTIEEENEDNEYSIATAFNNINERIINLENSINIIQTQIANILTRLDNNRM
jgi:prefoldin subunit 5